MTGNPLQTWRRVAAACASLVACALLWLPAQSLAQPIPGYPEHITGFDPREVAMLPPYCIYTIVFRDNVPGGNNPEGIRKWNDVLGETFRHSHHYCFGLMYTNRATLLPVQDPTARRFYLNNSILEFDYVLDRATPDYILLPEVLTKKGENLIRLGKGPMGIENLERAAQIKPDYWAPYAYLSDYYKEAGDFTKARQELEKGLSFAPDAKGLQRRLGELDAEAAKRKSSPKPAAKQQSSSSK